MAKPHKFVIEKSQLNTPIKTRGYEGSAFTLQAVYYSSEDPSKHLNIFDREGDPVSFPFPGTIDPKMVAVPEISVQLPLTIIDEAGQNRIILRGYLSKNTL